SEESLALLLDQLPGFRLADRNRLLSMLLDVWYGQGFDLKEGSWSPEKGRPFAETDGRSIYFPAVMPNRDEAVLGLLHVAGHMRFGTFDRLGMKALFAEARVEFPESGPVSWAPLYARFGDDALRFQLIFDLCEDLRVDSRIQRLVPNYLQRLLTTARSGARHSETGVYYSLAVTSIEQALAAFRDNGAGDGRFAPLLSPGATVADAWRIAGEIYAKDGLPAVSDLDAFHAAYLPGRGPNTTRLAHTQQQDQQQQQTQSGAEGEQKPQENGGERRSARRRTQAGNRRLRRHQRSLGPRRRTLGRPAPEHGIFRQGGAVPGMGLSRIALQAQLELGPGEEARGVEHHRDQPPDEPVRVGAEA